MKHLTKKIILSIFTWLLLFITLGTSTFAWFSMNYTVSADNIEITVTSNSTYLYIGDNADIATNKYNLGKEVNAKYVSGGENGRCYPVFYGDGSYLGDVQTVAGKWYTANNANNNHATDAITNAREVESSKLDDFMLTYKVWLTLSGDSLPYQKQLIINFDKISGDDAVSCVIVLDTTSGTEKFALDSAHTQATTTGNINVTKSTAYEITFLVYINGNSANVNRDYFALHGVSGEFNISFNIIP